MIMVLIELAFSLVVPVSDRPRFFYDADHQVMKLGPNQEGTFTLGPWGSYLQGNYHINNDGWNSIHDYQPDKPAESLRVALIGDSFVEALQVDYDTEALAVQLETQLTNGQSLPIEVYSFGVSGSPLSNYVQMMRYVEAQYHPDIYIVVVVENDFSASFAHALSTPHFLQVRRDPTTDQIVEIPPQDPHLSPWKLFLRRSALVRYIYYNLNIVNTESLLLYLGLKDSQDTTLNFADSQLQAPSTAYLQDIEDMLVYSLAAMQGIAQDHPLLLVMDAPRSAYYDHLSAEEVENAPSYQHQITLRHVAADREIPLIELYPAFQADFEAYGEYLDFYPNDAHWNARGHHLAAQVVNDYLLESGWLVLSEEG